MNEYPKGIEIVCGVIVENQENKVFLTKSKYWTEKYVLPGGLILAGETILNAAQRQIKHELNLNVEPIEVFNFGELIDSKDFKRSAHYIYFNVYTKLIGGNIKLNQDKHFDSQWLNPKEALNLNLAETFDLSLEKFIDYKNATN